MRTFVAVAHVSETGDVKFARLTDTSIYETWQPLSVYDAPYLGSFDNSEDWRRALGAYLTGLAVDWRSATGCHGDSLVYVDAACSTYVYEIDFDN